MATSDPRARTARRGARPRGGVDEELLRTLVAVRDGDFSARMPVARTGLPGKVADVLNDIIALNEGLARELGRLSEGVGKQGKISQRASLPEARGAWAECIESVNGLVGDLVRPTAEVSRVIGAVAKGDLSQTMALEMEGRPLQGEFLRSAKIVNRMVEQLSSFASEVTRVAREVGTEGKLGGQAVVTGVSGTWKDLTDSVNLMASNLTGQVRAIADVTTAVANGDLSKKITVDVKGEILELKDTINRMVDQLSSFASEVTRVAREVGTEGKLGGQAHVRGVSGTWKDLTDNVNLMASNLTGQVRNIADVTTAVANGDLSKKITVDVRGEILELKDTINTMVDQLRSFASEVTRVAREVGTEGKLGGQAEVRGVAGTWKDLTDNVNWMASNLTGQVRAIADVTTAVANGDLSKKITVDVRGEILELKDTINTMVDQLSSFASEVTRVAREVGTEGKLGGQATVKGVAGTWKDLTDSVNSMASGLTAQVRDIAKVATAVAMGDMSQKIAVDVRGEILELKNTINTMVDNLNTFASEVTRVAREVGTEGKLGGQAVVKGVAGMWKDLTDNVNLMASNLTGQVRAIANVTTAVANGDLSKKITVDVRGEILELKETINTMVDQLSSFASEVTRVAREVGTEGKLGGQAVVKGIAGTWKDLTDNVNLMASNLTGQVRNIAEVTTAVATGDLSKKITVDVRGEILELKNTINTMVDQLRSFASEVTRVAREVGTEGKLGGQADVRGVAGTWKDLTDNVNSMASNLTAQVRGIAEVVSAVANGDLDRKLALEAKGEIAALADTINSMIDTLGTFALQVIGVAREVGLEGKLGGQAKVPGAAGAWRDLTDNVNQLAANLTTQVRAIAEVATAVTKGDLTRSIAVSAQGEVAALKDNINQMIANLRATTQKNSEQDWLKTNLARFTSMLQGQRDLEAVSRLVLSELAPLVSAQHGLFYVLDAQGGEPLLKLVSSYAHRERKTLANQFRMGEGLVGQCVIEKQRILITGVPEDYVRISSGLGEAKPLSLVVIPVLFEGEVKAVIELASFYQFSEIHLAFLDQLTESIGIVLNTIAASMRTEELLKQSQSLAEELQAQQQELTETNRRLEQQAKSLQSSEERLRAQQDELQQTNEELEERSHLLQLQNMEVERKNREIEQAKAALEDRAQQLALSSRYKSEFLANMSHELRTPLNSLLILAKLLADNAEERLSPKEVEFAQTIYASGTDLLALINDILDLSKIESGTMQLDVGECSLPALREFVERSFRQVAADRRLALEVRLDSQLPEAIYTDARRLQQVVRNLLANAFKFTEQGQVTLSVERASSGWSSDHPTLARSDAVIAFAVTDTGIGIPVEKQKVIFEAFQQADGSTARKYGGTGLGLSISREIAKMLGGEITVASAPGRGSTFTLYLPQVHVPVAPRLERPNGAGAPTTNRARPEGLLATLPPAPPAAPAAWADDDRLDLSPGDHVLLVVENDPQFARTLLDVAHAAGLKGVVAQRGKIALTLAHDLQPEAIVLDLALPDADGWSVLDRLKHDPATRHIPVRVISDRETEHPLLVRLGAHGALRKQSSHEALEASLDALVAFARRRPRRLLVAVADDAQRAEIMKLVESGEAHATAATRADEALAALRADRFDCVVTELALPDGSAAQLLARATAELGSVPPVVVSVPGELGADEQRLVDDVARAVVAKLARSPEQLIEEVTLFLHLPEVRLPEDQRRLLDRARASDLMLRGKTVLVVDDDVRNVFALTSVLERQGMNVLYAETGEECLEHLRSAAGIDAVLMDIMMPEMDGYETIAAIRRTSGAAKLPVIALTAKAMKGDRERCIEAGASDYVTKPVDAEQLLSLLRVWLYAGGGARVEARASL
jgi:HAMP domain-containing protein/signal transduction histidine kinase/CheY-like chemotaxis protein